ncbi:MAG: NUDIX domain-containing protein [Clostridiales bacterium]|nr:NUDIX domain-containing protein [Clostridiales bacterium]
MKITFYPIEEMENEKYFAAVIVSRYRGKWIYVKHRERETWEIPGGRREPGENIITTANRELQEETGALDFTIYPLSAYGVKVAKKEETYGLLCYSEIDNIGELPEMEIEKIGLFDKEPEKLTYPDIQPILFKKARELMSKE